MQLLTKELRKRLPALGATEHMRDPEAQVKFFAPWSSWTWYGVEFDGQDTFFGLVFGFDEELGYFSLEELASARGPFGLRIERDSTFEPTRLSEVRHERRSA